MVLVSINRRLVVAGATGIVLGVIMWIIGAVALYIMPDLPAVTPYATFIIGFGGAVAATLSEDIAETPK
jgi:hypothetical protein